MFLTRWNIDINNVVSLLFIAESLIMFLKFNKKRWETRSHLYEFVCRLIISRHISYT